MSLKCIGIDIGGTSVKLGIFEEDGTLVKKWEIPTRKEEDGKYILGDIAASIRRTVKESRLELSDFSGAGMGFPGPVLPDGHCEVCVNLGWKAGNPQQELSRLLDGMPVKSGNDANVAALGEMWQGGGKGYRDIVMITLGTGVGGGVLRDVLAGDTPYIFVKHIYACASLAGALVCTALWHSAGELPAMLLGAGTVLAIRFLSAHFRWNLPHANS